MTDTLAAADVEAVATKRKFLIALLFLITFLQGIRVGSIPLPSSLLLCGTYVFIFDPPIPRDIGKVFTVVFLCILLLSTRNSLALSGGLRDFLYIGIVLESFIFTICVIDIMKYVSTRDFVNMLTILLCLVVTLEFIEYIDLLGFNEVFHPLLAYWDVVSNAGYGPTGGYTLRAPGSFGSPTVAGFATYLIFRSLTVLSGRRWIVYLGVFPLVICGARTAMATFIVWEMVIPMLSSRYRMFAIAGFLTVLCAFAISVIYFPEIYSNIYMVDFFIQAYHTGKLTTNDSIIYRLYGAQWALSQPLLQWIIGGMTAAQIVQFGTNVYTFDSEFVQRSMQFGVIGYGCFLIMNLCAGFSSKSWDWWFGVAIVAIGSITNYIATGLITFPFLVLYNVCLRRAANARAPDPAVEFAPLAT